MAKKLCMCMPCVKRRLTKAFTRQLAECEQCIRDGQYFNKIRTDCGPVDVEEFQVLAAGLRKALKAIQEGTRIDPAWLPPLQ